VDGNFKERIHKKYNRKEKFEEKMHPKKSIVLGKQWHHRDEWTTQTSIYKKHSKEESM